MEITAIIALLILAASYAHRENTFCKKEMEYHEYFGYGYDITCDGLTNEEIHELENILVYNEVRLTITGSHVSITPELFKNVHKIRELVIANCDVFFDATEKVFQYLDHLDTLSIVNSRLTNVSTNTFSTLKTLRTLNLYNNKLDEIPKNSFIDLHNLESINLNNNSFTSLSQIPFCEIRSLKSLQIQNNIVAALSSNSFSCLKKLQSLYLDNNTIEFVNSSFTALVYIKDLSLSFNSIETIEDTMANLKYLRHLNLEGNKLSYVNRQNFSNLKNLEVLNLKSNDLQRIETGSFQNLTNLVNLNLMNNKLSWLVLSNLPNLEEINLSNNKLHITTLENLQNLTSIKRLVMAQNNVQIIHGNVFEDLSTLEVIDLSHNKIVIVNNSFIGLYNLKEFKINNNKIKDLPDFAFNNMTSLTALDLSQNKLTHLTNTTFAFLGELATLNLSYNLLDTLEYSVVQYLISLRTLDVEGNRLKTIDYDSLISKLPFLKVINVRGNLLSCEFLSKMIHYFRQNAVNYTINEQFEYERENVAGIYCKETEQKYNVTLQQASQALVNNTLLLNKLYELSEKSDHHPGYTTSISLLSFGCVVFLVSIAICHTFLRNRRRKGSFEDLELIES